MRGTLLPCDWAEPIGQKLYAQGIGWSRVGADRPITIALAFLLHIGYNETNQKHHFKAHLDTEDGRPYPVEQPFVAEGVIEVGRPPGMRPGEESVVPLAARLNQVVFQPGGYVWKLTVNDEQVALFPFTATSPSPVMPFPPIPT